MAAFNTTNSLITSHEQMKNEFTKFVIVNGLPLDFGQQVGAVKFFKTMSPYFKEVSEQQLLQEASEEFEKIKNELLSSFASLDHHKIALVCDVWHNGHEMDFVRVTAHWIDSDWVMQRRVLSFEWVDVGASGKSVNDCIRSWGIKEKVISVTFDDVTNFDDDVVGGLLNDFHPSLDGRAFHNSCIIRILNFCVQDAWESAKEHVNQVWKGIVIVRDNFEMFVEKYRFEPKPTLFYDERKWDTTRDLLRAFIPFKDAINEYIATIPSNVVSDEMSDDHDSDAKHFEPVVIGEQDWEVASMFSRILDIFYKAVYDISSNYKPSSCVVLHHLVGIAKLFSELNGCVVFNEKFLAVKETFMEHFDRVPKIYCVVAAMDPRIMLSGCECLLEAFYHYTDNVTVNEAQEMKGVFNFLRDIYKLYAPQGTEQNCSSPNPATSSDYVWSLITKKRRMDSASEELTIYLQSSFHFKQGSEELDILGWWKMNAKKYPVLSSMARDLLTIPSSTLAPDCAFSFMKDNRISDERALEFSERSGEVEMYTCLKDWLRSDMRIQGEREHLYDEILGPYPNPEQIED